MVLGRCLTPGDALNVPGAEYILCAASLEQARIVFRFIRAELEPCGEYRFLDSTTKVQITHKLSNTRLRIMASNGKTAMGITGCPLLVADEPGAWEATGGQLMSDAIETALGKPGSAMRVSTSGPWRRPRMAGGTRGLKLVRLVRLMSREVEGSPREVGSVGRDQASESPDRYRAGVSEAVAGRAGRGAG